jgi:hypothetical protein
MSRPLGLLLKALSTRFLSGCALFAAVSAAAVGASTFGGAGCPWMRFPAPPQACLRPSRRGSTVEVTLPSSAERDTFFCGFGRLGRISTPTSQQPPLLSIGSQVGISTRPSLLGLEAVRFALSRLPFIRLLVDSPRSSSRPFAVRHSHCCVSRSRSSSSACNILRRMLTVHAVMQARTNIIMLVVYMNDVAETHPGSSSPP